MTELTAHEKTRIRQLEDAAAHWEHKYTNARQYNRNLEERNKKHGACINPTWRELAILADWHDVQAVEADAMDFSQCVPYHEQRAKAFRELSAELKSQADTAVEPKCP